MKVKILAKINQPPKKEEKKKEIEKKGNQSLNQDLKKKGQEQKVLKEKINQSLNPVLQSQKMIQTHHQKREVALQVKFLEAVVNQYVTKK